MGRSIPVCLTTKADAFGAPVLRAGFAFKGSEAFGKPVLDHIGLGAAVWLKNHGVFPIGKSANAAIKVEEAARIAYDALPFGQPDEIAPDDVEKLHYRHMNVDWVFGD